MPKTKPEPEKSMTKAEAIALASGIGSRLEDHTDDALPEFVLLLR